MTRTNIRDILYLERRDNMELIKSKGMVAFLVIVLALTVISSMNTKKYDEENRNMDKTYISLNIK